MWNEMWNCGWVGPVRILVGIVGIILALVSTLLLLREKAKSQKTAASRESPKPTWWPVGIVAFWTLIPPVCFFIEYHFLFKWGAKPEVFELFRHLQEVNRNVWAGFVAFLAAIYFGKGPGAEG
jgi:hypothetical protein